MWEDPAASKRPDNDAVPAVATSSSKSAASTVRVEQAPSSSNGTHSDWTKQMSAKHGREYWSNKITGATSWVDPALGTAEIKVIPVALNQQNHISKQVDEASDRKSVV